MNTNVSSVKAVMTQRETTRDKLDRDESLNWKDPSTRPSESSLSDEKLVPASSSSLCRRSNTHLHLSRLFEGVQLEGFGITERHKQEGWLKLAVQEQRTDWDRVSNCPEVVK